ncbi:unnamed protein product [Soboliphyme baturini]|uniref:Uncharacterized protein n=1 Tax=Soboliphyme baturini TaxID=241478 RepID=A0A183J115_9BILA|nr:unnamed protein product [Soboliphyme baturini]
MDSPPFVQNRNNLMPVCSDMRVKIAHEYEGLCIRRFGQSTLCFLKEGLIFSLQIMRIDLYHSLLWIQSEDYHPPANRLPMNDSSCEIGFYENINTGLRSRRDIDA